MGDALRAILFEDYFLPLVQGRNINFNAMDDSCMSNYFPKAYEESNARWIKFVKRPDAIKHLQEEKSLFIIKTTEFALWDLPDDTFPGAIVINIIRNGNDVISSSIAHGWFDDNYQPIDWVTDSGSPWFLAEEDQKFWSYWNIHTRAACVWRSCIERNRGDGSDPGLDLRYEDLLERPEYWITYFDKWLACARTELTDKHIKDVKAHKPKVYPSILDYIQDPEKEKYVALMEELGYKV